MCCNYKFSLLPKADTTLIEYFAGKDGGQQRDARGQCQRQRRVAKARDGTVALVVLADRAVGDFDATLQLRLAERDLAGVRFASVQLAAAERHGVAVFVRGHDLLANHGYRDLRSAKVLYPGQVREPIAGSRCHQAGSARLGDDAGVLLDLAALLIAGRITVVALDAMTRLDGDQGD